MTRTDLATIARQSLGLGPAESATDVPMSCNTCDWSGVPVGALVRCPHCRGFSLTPVTPRTAARPKFEAVRDVIVLCEESGSLSGEKRDRLVTLCNTLYDLGRAAR